MYELNPDARNKKREKMKGDGGLFFVKKAFFMSQRVTTQMGGHKFMYMNKTYHTCKFIGQASRCKCGLL